MDIREKAVKTPYNGRVETPETRRILDYQVGDIVQIKADGGKFAGKIGVIIGIRCFAFERDNGEDLAYRIKLSDENSIEASAKRMRFLRHADEPKTPTEKVEI